MPPYRGLWGERTSPGGGLSVRKDSSSGGRLLHDVFRVQDWALYTVVQRQGVSFRRIARACTLRIILVVVVGTVLPPERSFGLFACKASGINRLLCGGVIGFSDVILQPFGFCRGGGADAAICVASQRRDR